jgi:parallel beta-helix repeat protein
MRNGRGIMAAMAAAVLGALALSGAAPAADYYISNKPGTGAGTKEDPFGLADLPKPDQKPTKALSVLQPGDTLWFKGGDYALDTGPGKDLYYVGYIRPARSGEKEKPISFRACPGEKVVLSIASGGQPIFGNYDRDYVRCEGFIVKSCIGHVGGKGAEVAFCEIVGEFRDTSDNHDGIRIEQADGAWIHHCAIHGVQGKSHNSAGIKVYKSENIVVEDNYIYDNTAGVFDKDSGINNTYRRNYLTGNSYAQFHGNNQGKYMVAHIYDNVLDGGISLGYLVDGTDVHDNLLRADKLAGHWAGELWNTSLWNNVVIAKGNAITAYAEAKSRLVTEGEKKHLAYMDYNVYTAAPRYAFGEYDKAGKQELDIAKMREQGFEKHSEVVAGAAAVYKDEKSWELLPKWRTAGKDGDAVGPENVAFILDLKRYGPDGRGYKGAEAGGAQGAAGAQAAPWLVESFEGTPPKGWSGDWSAWGDNVTTDEAGAPPGGGKCAYRQIWNEGKGWSGLGLDFGKVKGMPAKLGAGSEFYMRYFLKYDGNFDFGSSTGFKQIIIQSDSIVHDRLYFCITGKEANLGLFFQYVTGATWMHANANGGPYAMPKGRWVEFEWYVKVSPESEKKGVVKGWVDGVLRWDYKDIATIKSGSYVSLSINPTFNQAIEGPSQKRYWDLFSLGPARMGGAPEPAATPAAPGAQRPEIDPAVAAARAESSKAAELFRSARDAERQGMKDLAMTLYERVVKEYPDANVAADARARIENR